VKKIIDSLGVAEQKSVAIIGDLMLDEYVFGSVDRISPEGPVPVFKELKRDFSLGGAANVASNCRRVGCRVDLIGLVGHDDWCGEKVLSMLFEKKIFTRGVVKSRTRKTTRKKRVVAQGQQMLRIDTEENGRLSLAERDSLICNIHTIIRPGATVLVSDYAKGVVDREIIREILVRARACDSTVIVDPKGPFFDKYKGVNYVKPNLKEFYQMVDFWGLNRERSIEENGIIICKKLELQGLIVTMGDKGIKIISSDLVKSYAAYKKEVYDITGAGDTVIAFLSVGLACGLSLDESIRVANMAASVAISYHKTHAVSLEELFESTVSSDKKIENDWQRLGNELEWLREKKNKKIVFTNGCFDLLHSGHIFLLEEAKKRGDILVVGLNSDDSIRRLKGAGRPVKILSERSKILSSIDVVDFVVAFENDTPKELIEFLKPDVLVKGGDYKREEIVGYDIITSYGGDVEIIDFQEGVSTTKLVEKVFTRGS